MTRSIYQYRPPKEPGALPYSPQRDLAHIYMPMLKEAFCSLDEEHWSDEWKALCDREGVTQDDFSIAVEVFAEAHRLFIRERTVTCPGEAFLQAGLERMHPTARLLLFARLGEVIMGGWFIAIRDVTLQGQVTPAQYDFLEMITAGRELAAKLANRDLPMPVPTVSNDVRHTEAAVQENARIEQQKQQKEVDDE